MKQRLSFISNLMGQDSYEENKWLAKMVVLIGSGILLILYLLSFFFHAGIISYLLDLTNGTSLLFIGYVLAWILVLDFKVNVEMPDKDIWREDKKKPKPFKYKLTIVWAVLLLLLGIVAIYYSNRYRNNYSFECETFLVDEEAGMYHLDWDVDCGYAEEADCFVEMKGYDIPQSFKFCEGCQEMLEEAEYETVHVRYER